METRWQLKKISTGEPLSEKYLDIPINWRNVIGMPSPGMDPDRPVENLSWAGWEDLGFFRVDIDYDEVYNKEYQRIIEYLKESDYTMLPDVPLTSEKKYEWMEYRRKLREVKYQASFPFDIEWPSKP
jgi:hypothetical protein